MKYLKSFKLFETKLLTYDIEKMKERISLYKIADRIYGVVIEDNHLRAMTFLRFQEYYEASSEEFRGKKFLWDRYIQWYKSADSPNGEKEIFTYGDDWCGFNIPSEAIENCLSDIDDRNTYDDIMISIVNTIKEDTKGNFYLIGVDSLESEYTLLHEIAHGFFYTDHTYRNEMIKLIEKMPTEERTIISDIIIGYGYNEVVLNDEIQAYMSTGLSRRMDKSLEKHREPFNKLFMEFKTKHNLHITEMDIIW